MTSSLRPKRWLRWMHFVEVFGPPLLDVGKYMEYALVFATRQSFNNHFTQAVTGWFHIYTKFQAPFEVILVLFQTWHKVGNQPCLSRPYHHNKVSDLVDLLALVDPRRRKHTACFRGLPYPARCYSAPPACSAQKSTPGLVCLAHLMTRPAFIGWPERGKISGPQQKID